MFKILDPDQIYDLLFIPVSSSCPVGGVLRSTKVFIPLYSLMYFKKYVILNYFLSALEISINILNYNSVVYINTNSILIVYRNFASIKLPSPFFNAVIVINHISSDTVSSST